MTSEIINKFLIEFVIHEQTPRPPAQNMKTFQEHWQIIYCPKLNHGRFIAGKKESQKDGQSVKRSVQ